MRVTSVHKLIGTGVATLLALGCPAALGQGKLLTIDPLTNLPLIPATVNPDDRFGLGNEPVNMPSGQVCKSKFQGNHYPLYKVKTRAAVAWYVAHLRGFKKYQGYDSHRAQIVFYKSGGKVVIFVTGDPGPDGQETGGYGVAYERYQPGLAEKTIIGLTRGKVICD